MMLNKVPWSSLLNAYAYEQEYNDKLNEFYKGLELDFYDGDTPLYKAIYTLKELSKTVNLRKLENFDKGFEEEDNDDNYVIPITENDRKIFKIKEVELDQELIAEILQLSHQLDSQLPIKAGECQSKATNKRIKKYKDIIKTKKTNLIRPDFEFKLASKSLIIVDEIKKSLEEDILIILEDASSSMEENNGYLVTKAIQSMLLKDDRKVHYYRYVGRSIEFKELNTLEDKLIEFSKDKKFTPHVCDYKLLFSTINNKYPKGNVIIITDGRDYVPKGKKVKLKYNCIGPSGNPSMETYIKRSGGRYITV